MQQARDLSEESTAEQLAYNEMIRTSIGLIDAHGNCKQCDIQLDGTLVDVNEDYKDNFISHSLKQLFDASMTV